MEQRTVGLGKNQHFGFRPDRRKAATLVLMLVLVAAPACRRCPENCDDGDACTTDDCSKATEYGCRHVPIQPCDGNRVCEEGEFGRSSDCPDCDDGKGCTVDGYNFRARACTHDPVVPCCGNGVCEPSENLYSCVADCREGMTKLISGRKYRFRLNERYQFELRQIELTSIWDRSVVASVTLDTQRIGLKIDRGTVGRVLGIGIEVLDVEFDLDPSLRSALLRFHDGGQ